MYSLKSIVALSLVLGCCILLVDVRPTFAMPIEGDNSDDRYQDMYHLITQRLQNLTQLNQDNDQNTRRTFVAKKTVNNTVIEYSLAGNTSDMNNTTTPSRSSNSTQMNQTDEINRRLYAPMAAGYTQNVLASNILAGNQETVKTVVGYAQVANSSAGNLMVGNPMAGNSLIRNQSTSNSTAGNSLLAGNQTAGKYRLGDPMAGNSSTNNQPVSNSTTGNSLLANQTAENRLAVNSTVGNSQDENLPAGTPWARNSTAGNQLERVLMTRNQLVSNSLIRKSQAVNLQARNLVAGNKSASKSYTGKPQAGSSNVSTYLENTGQPGALVFPSSFNAGPTIPEDRSGIYTNLYRQPSSNVKKDTIAHKTFPGYGQSMALNYGQGDKAYERFSTPSSDVRRTNIYTPSEYTGGYNNYQPMGIYPRTQYSGYTGYPSFTGYPAFQNQPTRRGYLARPAYQVGFPRTLQSEKQDYHPNPKKVPDRAPVPYHPNPKKVSDRAPVSSHSSTIQIKLPDKPDTTNTSSLYESSSPDNNAVEGSGSASGSAFDEPVDMENTADFQEQQELSSSGSGDDSEDLNTNPVSDVAFMLAGTNHKQHPFSAVGLPEKLTRKQALDIYKSAMYFAGLMKPEDSIDGDAEQSGDENIDDDDDDDDKTDHSFTDEGDDGVPITDNDVKEALAASSGELYSSGQDISDVEASGSQLEAPVNLVQNIDNGVLKVENDASKHDSNASQPQIEEKKPQPTDRSSQDENATPQVETETVSASNEEGKAPQAESTAQETQSQAPKAESTPQETQSQAQDVEAKTDDQTETPPPVNSQASEVSSDKQATDSAEEDLDTPPPDETLMKATQANYAADQRAEQELTFLSNTRFRPRGAYSSPTQRAVICKDTTQKISCPPDKKIRILNADYGDTGDFGCLKEADPRPSGPCRTPGAYETVKRECEGYEDCQLDASNDVFGDACPDSNKYLDVNYDCVNNVAPYAPPAPAYGQASYQPQPQYVNPAPPPVAYAPSPYQVPPPPAYAPPMGLPDMLPPSPYAAPDPCNPCNTCAQCSLPVCNPCGQCQSLTCPPRIPAKLQPLWQQWNERTADMSRMEMAALIISPLPKLSPTAAPESTESSGAAEGSESGEPTLDEEALYEASKKSEIQRVKPVKKLKETKLTTHKNNDNDQGFFRNSDVMVSSGDASSGSST